MPISQDAMTGERVRTNTAVAALGLVALGLGALMLRRSRSGGRHQESDDKRAALAAYLRDHLAGADTAIRIVGHLAQAQHGTREGTLFVSLHEQFLQDRDVVTALLTDLGASPRSVKRLAGRVTGGVLTAAAGGTPGKLSLFRTLEGLAVGVQGKRCLWRAAQVLAPSLRAPGRRTFAELESSAIDQWEAIEQCRRELAPRTFAV